MVLSVNHRQLTLGVYDTEKRNALCYALTRQNSAAVHIEEVDNRGDFWEAAVNGSYDVLVLDHALPMAALQRLTEDPLRALVLVNDLREADVPGHRIAVGINEGYIGSMLEQGMHSSGDLDNPVGLAQQIFAVIAR